MKIGIFSDAFYPELGGGGEIMAWRLARCYLQMGHEVVVITATNDKTKESRGIMEDGLKIYRFFANYRPFFKTYLAFYNHQTAHKISKVLKIEHLDSAHVHVINQYLSYWCLYLLKKYKVKTIVTIHDAQPICYKKFDCYINSSDLSAAPAVDYRVKQKKCAVCQRKRYFPLRPFLIRYIFRKFPDKIFAVSHELKNALLANRIRCDGVIYNGIELDSAKSPDSLEIERFKQKHSLQNRKVIFFSGRLSAAKGADQVFRMLPYIAAKFPEAVLLVAGDSRGYEKIFLSGKIKSVFAGWLSQEEMMVAYAASDLVIFPSVCLDTFGMVLIEAMSVKKPVVATCFGGAKEIVADGESGFIANPLDEKNFAEKIKEILSDELLAEKLGAKGFTIVQERFNIKDIAQYYLKEMEAEKAIK